MTIRLGDLAFDHVVYDEEADVRYLSAGPPREPARQEATEAGHLIRYGSNGHVIGLTLVNAKWFIEQDGEIEIPIRVTADDIAPALA